MPNRLEDIARSTVTAHRMFGDRSPVLVMVSGGADSVSLLRLLASGLLGDMRLAVLHVNHMLREVTAEEDERFVRHLCEELGVDCHVVRYDVGEYASSHGLNLEDAGRRVRYRFAEEELDSLCDCSGAARAQGRIAVAHTLDDRIETFFMRAMAGSGTGGLGSIAPVRGRVVRPLIACEREVVRAWLTEQGQAWREDPTNDDTARARALVRAEFLPVAERLNPSFRGAMSRTMDLLADDDRLLSEMSQAFVRDFASVRIGERVTFDKGLMRTLDRTMARRCVKAALTAAFEEASRLEAEHIEALVDGIAADKFARDLPDGLRAYDEYDTMVVAHSQNAALALAPALLSLPGIAELGAAGTLRAEQVAPSDVSGSSDSIVVSADAVSGELVADGMQAGDRMRPFGMKGSRKLSDLLIDEKVPKRLRQAVPVVRDGERIVWLAGIRMSEEYRVSAGTEKAFRLTWERGRAWQ